MERNVEKMKRSDFFWREKHVRDSGMAIMVLNDEALCESWKTKRIIVNCGKDCKLKLPMQMRTATKRLSLQFFCVISGLCTSGALFAIMTVKDEMDNLSLLTR